MLEVSFDDEVEDRAPGAAKKPPRWIEEPSTSAWRAWFTPTSRLGPGALLGTLILAPLLLARAVLAAPRGGTAALVVYIALLVGALAAGIYVRRRRWSFAFEGGRFRADAVGEHFDVPMDEILRFSVEKSDPHGRQRQALFRLCVHRRDQATLRIPLFVAAPEEAAFVAERANALLATDGRMIEHGYRGERLRVDVSEVARTRVDVPSAEEPDVEVTSERGRRERMESK